MTLAFYFRYAFRSLLRDGQRTLLALLCITFGVMSLVGLQLLAGVIRQAVVTDPRASLGGDVLLFDEQQDAFTSQQLTDLQSLRSDDTLGTYTLAAASNAQWLKPPGTGKVYFLTNRPLGVDPAVFPLVGRIHVKEPSGEAFSDTIRKTSDAAITADVADKLSLHVGDTITLVDSAAGSATPLHLSGIIDSMPSARGDSIFYSLATAAHLAGQSDPARVENEAFAVWGTSAAGGATNKLPPGLATITSQDAAQSNAQIADVFGFMLKGAGILGLFVGGIGVANTLAVVLARRMLEIATLKTLGYKRRNLLALFAVETALLGLAGGVLGVLAALGLALLLMNLMGHLGVLLLTWSVDPLLLVGGVLMGVMTAVIFGLFTIVRASSVRPAVLLRDLPVRMGWGARIASAGLIVVLLALVTSISVLIMGKVVDGLGVVAGALVGLLVLSALFGGALFIALSVPTPGFPLFSMARRNLKRRPMRSVFALIALFWGVFAIGFAASVILDASDRLAARQSPAVGQNLTIYGKLPNDASITAQLQSQGVQSVHSGVRVPVGAQASSVPLLSISNLEGRPLSDMSWDVTISSGQAPSGQDGALVPSNLAGGPSPLKIGDSIQVRVPGNARDSAPGGGQSTLQISGFYDSQAPPSEGKENVPSTLLVSRDVAIRLGGADAAVVYVGHVPLERLAGVSDALGQALPQSIVVNQADLNDARNHVVEGLFSFAVGVSALALVAGAILIANAVGLAMVERRREIGILKALGFTSGRVLNTLLIENALLGLLGGALGMVGVGVAIVIINRQQPQAQLTLNPLLALLMVVISIALAMLSAGLVAWRPTHVRPLEVLRNE